MAVQDDIDAIDPTKPINPPLTSLDPKPTTLSVRNNFSAGKNALQGLLNLLATKVNKAGDTFTGPVIHNDQSVSRANFIDCGLAVYDHGVISSSSTITFDYTQGCVQYCECGGAYALTLAFSNWPPVGSEGLMKLGLKNFGLSSSYIFPIITWTLFDDSITTDFDAYALDREGSERLPDDSTATLIIWTRDAGATLNGIWL